MKKEYTQADVLAVIRQEIDESSLRKTAKRISVTPAYLSDIMRGNRQVSQTIAEVYGFDREVITKVVFRKNS
jgi:hypothetical protein